MASTFSPYKIELMATGENNTTWGDKTNVNFTAFEELITGSADVAFASADVTLTLTNTSAPQTARNLRLNLTGVTGGTPRNLIVPALEKFYLVKNGCADAITVKNATGTGIAVPAGASMAVFNDGVNVVEPITFITSPTFGSALTVPQGGTGATTITGLVKGNGAAAFSAATAGTDYAKPDVASTWTAKQIFTGATGALAQKIRNSLEDININGTAATGTVVIDVTTFSIDWHYLGAVANWTLNIRGNSTTTLDSLMATGESITVVMMSSMGASAFYNNVVQIDGTTSGVTIYWSPAVPTAGIASAYNIYTYTVIKSGAATFFVFASLVAYKP
jgi:hypothetical protein